MKHSCSDPRLKYHSYFDFYARHAGINLTVVFGFCVRHASTEPRRSPGVRPIQSCLCGRDNGNSGRSLIIPVGVGSRSVSASTTSLNLKDSARGELYIRSLGTLVPQTPLHPHQPTSFSGPSFTISSSSGTQSSASSTSASPATAQPPQLANQQPEQQTESTSRDEIDKAPATDDDDPDKIEPYVDFSDFFELCQKYGEEVVYSWNTST